MNIPTDAEIVTFVTESNEIEGISVPADHPLLRDHIKAVEFALKTVRNGSLPHPKDIHAVLLASEPGKNPGKYRSLQVRIGANIATPLAHAVPFLMDGLTHRVDQDFQLGIDLEEWIWNVHHEFECIHPFEDGNGRTGRIWMNAIRLAHGLSWLTIFAQQRGAYYDAIDVFRWEDPRYRKFIAGDPSYNVETICVEEKDDA